MASLLTSVQRYAAGTLFSIALNQAQIHQTSPLGYSDGGDLTKISNRDSVSDDPELWVNEKSALLRPVFRFLEIEDMAWPGIEETALSSPSQYHAGAFMRLLSEETGIDASTMEKELALTRAIDALAESMETTPSSYNAKKEMHSEYEHECREKFSISESHQDYKEASAELEANEINSTERKREDAHYDIGSGVLEETVDVESNISYPKKVVVLYELLSACLGEPHGDNRKQARQRNGFDARHRVALRILATWLDIKWKKVEAMETMVACSAITVASVEQSKEEETKSNKDTWVKWKRGGIIGAAALTGGALMAITGGLAAPAIAAGFGALAPTLGTVIPVIGATGFAAAASAAGTVAGSVAVAASFGAAGAGLTGSKMARRIGGVEEFEFKAIGENHKQGRLAVEILVSGFVFEEEDFVRPWEGKNDNLERYALQWETKNLVAVSTAIHDWFTSKIATELMKHGAMMTVLSTLVTALAWPATLLAATDFIDSKWTIAVDRSDKCGKLLAEVLLKGMQGYRPVTLVGFSLGARVIFKCLQYLSENEQSSGLIERVILLGAPISIKGENWEVARKVVAGRFVNVYSPNDWTLGVAFRASLLTQGLAGIQHIHVPGIENVDVNELVEGHSSYLWVTQEILELLELDTYYPVFRGRCSS